MLIANPIYDTVFKYLMEDLEIAKGILSVILNTEIHEISIQPQEATSTTNIALTRNAISIYRLDFIAIIKQPDGSYKKVLIELQKTKRSTVISRFRRYLGENYQKEDTILENGILTTQPLEIITIYFIGFPLEEVSAPVLKVKNCFIDVLNNTPLDTDPQHKFLRLLNHESYTIQLTKLEDKNRTRLEEVLSIFNQKYKYAANTHFLEYNEKPNTDPLLNKMLNRLLKITATPELINQINLEDDVEREFELLESKLAQKQSQLTEKENLLAEKDGKLAEKDSKLTEKENELAEKDNKLAEKDSKLTEKENELAEKEKLIQELLKKINNKDNS